MTVLTAARMVSRKTSSREKHARLTISKQPPVYSINLSTLIPVMRVRIVKVNNTAAKVGERDGERGATGPHTALRHINNRR